MSIGRRKARVEDPSAWIFNRMADVYGARPPYPPALIDVLAEVARGAGQRVGDIGAGIGHVALPLSARGLSVVAVEPAVVMLDRLRAAAAETGSSVTAVHGVAEALPLDDGSLDAAIVSDALHFMDKELASAELRRVLARRGALAVVTCEFSETPFMRGVAHAIDTSAQRRVRAVQPAIEQAFAVAGIGSVRLERVTDETAVDATTLERILQSISFVGPAMNAARFEAFRARVHGLPDDPVWARTFTVYSGRRTR